MTFDKLGFIWDFLVLFLFDFKTVNFHVELLRLRLLFFFKSLFQEIRLINILRAKNNESERNRVIFTSLRKIVVY
jgi:hypothetical protein